MLRVSTILAVALAAAPAAADWQATRWGMSPDEVLAAVPKAEKQADGAIIADYRVAPFLFKARFWFADAGLQQVSLELQDGDPVQLVKGLEARYGRPASAELQIKNWPWATTIRWREESTRMDITFFSRCEGRAQSTVTYHPIGAGPGKGL